MVATAKQRSQFSLMFHTLAEAPGPSARERQMPGPRACGRSELLFVAETGQDNRIENAQLAVLDLDCTLVCQFCEAAAQCTSRNPHKESKVVLRYFDHLRCFAQTKEMAAYAGAECEGQGFRIQTGKSTKIYATEAVERRPIFWLRHQ